MDFKRQTHCSGCGADEPRPTYVMITVDGKDVVAGLCPKCMGELFSCAKDETVTAERIDVYRVERAKRV
jgi:hypothetical protein